MFFWICAGGVPDFAVTTVFLYILIKNMKYPAHCKKRKKTLIYYIKDYIVFFFSINVINCILSSFYV